jgi:hypothetical protein
MKSFNSKLIFIALLMTFGSLSADALAQTGKHPRHRGRLQNGLLAEMRDAVTLVEAKPDAKAKRSNVARNRAGSYIAFTLEVPIEGGEGSTREVIFIEHQRLGKIYEVRGFDFPRPFADLAWRDNHTLVFDQWMQPHYAVHYALNMQHKKLVAAAPFRDDEN